MYKIRCISESKWQSCEFTFTRKAEADAAYQSLMDEPNSPYKLIEYVDCTHPKTEIIKAVCKVG